MYAFKCGNDSKNKLKGNSKSQSKHNKVEEYKKVQMEKNMKKNAKIITFDQLIMKCIFKN